MKKFLFLLFLISGTAYSQQIFKYIENKDLAGIQTILSENPEPVNSVNNEMESPLMIACKLKQKDIAELLLKYKPNVLHTTNNKTGLIHYIKTLDCLKLFNGQIDLESRNNKGESVLHTSAGDGDSDLLEYLLDSVKLFINETDNFGNTPLINCCKSGNPKNAKILIKKGATLNVFNNEGISPLIAASLNNNLTIIDLLIKNGAQINLSMIEANSELRGTALFFAVKHNSDLEVIDFLLKNGANPNIKDKEGTTALMFACSNSSVFAAQLLLKYGAKAGTKDILGKTVLDYSSDKMKEFMKMVIAEEQKIKSLIDEKSKKLSEEIKSLQYIYPESFLISAILENRTDVIPILVSNENTLPQFAWFSSTALQIAIEENKPDIAKNLIENYKNTLNIVNSFWETPLKSACKNQNLELVKLLLEAGAKTDIKEDPEWSAIMPAANKANIELIKLLIENKADVNHRLSPRSGSPLNVLSFAAESGDTNTVDFLLENGACLNCMDSSWTPLMSASAKGDINMADFLLRKGIDLNSEVFPEGTAIKFAIQKNNLEMVKFLIEKGADINIGNKNYWSPLHLSIINENMEMTKLLVNRGSDINSKMTSLDNALNQYYNITPIMLAAAKNNIELVRFLLENKAEVNNIDAFGKTALDLAENEEIKKMIISSGGKSGKEIEEKKN